MTWKVVNKRTGEIVSTGLSGTQANKEANRLNSITGKENCTRPYRAVKEEKAAGK